MVCRCVRPSMLGSSVWGEPPHRHSSQSQLSGWPQPSTHSMPAVYHAATLCPVSDDELLPDDMPILREPVLRGDGGVDMNRRHPSVLEALTAGLYWYPEHKVLAVKRRWGWMILIAHEGRWL